MRPTLLFLAIVAGSAAGVARAQEKDDLSRLLNDKGPPAFTAKSIDVRGNVLVCDGLELRDLERQKATEKLRGRVLLFCESWDALWFWAAHTDQKMRRATPLLGLEGPGKKFTDVVPPKAKGPTELLKPAKMFAAVVDQAGKVVCTIEITVHKLQDKD
jgi:hypothetical protein